MKPNPMKTAMIRASVEKGIKDIKENPRRGIRNLVELGEMFAGGRFQQEFFAAVMDQLKDEHSAYYQITEQVVKQVDEQALTTFGINMGYNSMSHGAAIIRRTEKSEAFNVPWCLGIDLGVDSALRPFDVEGLVEEGKELGIYSYLLYIGAANPDIDELLQVLGAQKECAIILFCSSRSIDGAFCGAMARYRNLAVLVDLDEPDEDELVGAAGRLRDIGALCGGFSRVPGIKGENVSPDMLAKPRRLELPFACFISTKTHHPHETDGVYEAFIHLREHLDVPVIPLDLYEDIAHVDRIISSEACLAGITGDGNLILVDADRYEKQTDFSIHEMPLNEALRKAMPKGRSQ